MKLDFVKQVTNLMIEDDIHLSERIIVQEDTLKKIKCKNPEIGKWIENYELNIIIDILNSPDAYFNEVVSEIKFYDNSDRYILAKEIQKHSKTCSRCMLKISYDLEWENYVDLFVSNHSKILKKNLEKTNEFLKTAYIKLFSSCS